MHRISKEFSFDFGHRVWKQTLDKELSCNASCKCRFLHGHTGKITVTLEAADLNPQGMVLDFNNLSWMKQWIDDVLDHKFIFDVNDPMLAVFLEKNPNCKTSMVDVYRELAILFKNNGSNQSVNEFLNVHSMTISVDEHKFKDNIKRILSGEIIFPNVDPDSMIKPTISDHLMEYLTQSLTVDQEAIMCLLGKYPYKNMKAHGTHYTVDFIQKQYNAPKQVLFSPGKSIPPEFKVYNTKLTEYNEQVNFQETLSELFGGLTIVDFIPTSENFAKWIYDIVSAKMKPYEIKVHSVEFNETPKTSSIYVG